MVEAPGRFYHCPVHTPDHNPWSMPSRRTSFWWFVAGGAVALILLVLSAA